jgi:hypothetical protein
MKCAILFTGNLTLDKTKQKQNSGETVFRGVRAEELSWRPSALTLSVSKRMQRHSDQQLVVGSLLSELKPGVRRNTRGLPVKM